MSTNKLVFAKFMTPKSVFIYPKLNAPDTKFKAEGEFNVKLKPLDADEGSAFQAKYEAAVAKHFELVKAELEKKLAEAKTGADKGKIKKEIADLKTADSPFKPAFDDDGNETGEVIFTVKTPAQFTRKKDQKVIKIQPAFFDAGGKKMASVPEIWGGTVGFIAGSLRPFYTAKAGVGVSLRLEAVQIIELSSGGGARDAGSFGFGAEDGYVAEDDEGSGESPFGGDSGEESGGNEAGADDF